jgi:hypothetical protein
VEVSGQIHDPISLVSGREPRYPLDTENLTDASKEVALEENAKKTNYMLLSRHENAGQNRDIRITKHIL